MNHACITRPILLSLLQQSSIHSSRRQFSMSAQGNSFCHHDQGATNLYRHLSHNLPLLGRLGSAPCSNAPPNGRASLFLDHRYRRINLAPSPGATLPTTKLGNLLQSTGGIFPGRRDWWRTGGAKSPWAAQPTSNPLCTWTSPFRQGPPSGDAHRA